MNLRNLSTLNCLRFTLNNDRLVLWHYKQKFISVQVRSTMSTVSAFNPSDHGHRRYNPLTDTWVLVSPHRLDRPWAGQEEAVSKDPFPEVDPANPLAPGNPRSEGVDNPKYQSVYVFTNDFPAMKPDFPPPEVPFTPLFQMQEAKGTCRVICYSPKTDTTIGIMPIQDIFSIVNVWISELVELANTYDWVQIFENKGQIMGCSNPHPHGQIWASSFLPSEPAIKDKCQRKYYEKYGRALLMDYVQQEIEKEERIVVMNDDWVVLVPFWAVWPYETMILPRSHIRRMYDLNHDQKLSLADILRKINIKYDNMFSIIFPYCMGWHGAPTGKMKEMPMDHWVFHGMFYPPLLRSASVKKFMVGYEMLAESQRDITPEYAAKVLRELPDVHFLIAPIPPVQTNTT